MSSIANDHEAVETPGVAEAPVAFDDQAVEERSDSTSHIVAIGASAGGLEPLQIFFDAMKSNTSVAFVVIQHLSPDYKSLMDELLARHTDMAIHRVTDRMAVEPNSIYLIPPRSEMIVSNGLLLLSDRDEDDPSYLPVDTFMKSLAEERAETAVAIILSGTGSDGSRGASAIREAGGLVLVQAPETASFDGMPQSAIAASAAHLEMAPSDMPDILLKHVSSDGLAIEELTTPEVFLDPLRQILELLRRRFGPDFGYYKSSTVGRRINRRAELKNIPDLATYAELLREKPEELELLYHDLLIGVTSFFRDADAFHELARTVIPDLVERMSADRQIRIWVAGCATGEEVYSIAILIAEQAKQMGKSVNLKIFATDIHEGSLAIAGEGFYPAGRSNGLGQERIERYFDKVETGYKVRAHLRRQIVFSTHNLLRDPPFTRMDLVSCRNLLIYFRDIAQRKSLALFHFSLRRQGYLFLGSSETVAKLDVELEPVNGRLRIYRKLRDRRLAATASLLPISTRDNTWSPTEQRRELRFSGSQPPPLKAAYDRLLDEYAPASLLVEASGEVVHVFGDAAKFLRPPQPGVVSRRAGDVVVQELSIAVSTAMERTLRHGLKTASHQLTVKSTDDERHLIVSVIAEPIKLPDSQKTSYCLIRLIIEGPPIANEGEDGAGTSPSLISAEPQPRIAQLEASLQATEENLQATIEELEASNEELQASNEELMSSNEELQSTNEELHSLNEELHTVSAEHEQKISELSQVNHDMEHLLRATGNGTIFVDKDLKIRKFTPAAASIFNLVKYDIGRPIDHITHRFVDEKFHDNIRKACHDGSKFEKEIEVKGDRTYLLRMQPYYRDGGHIDGAIIICIDIEELKQARTEAEQNRDRIQSFLATASDWIWETDVEHRFTFESENVSIMGVGPTEVIGKTRWEKAGVDPSEHELWAKHLADLAARKPFTDFEYAITNPAGQRRYARISGMPIFADDGAFVGYRGTGRDITEQKYAERRLSDVERRYRVLFEEAPIMLHSIDDKGTLIGASQFWLKKLGYERDEAIGRPVADFLTPESRKCAEQVAIPTLIRDGSVENIAYQWVKKDGSIVDAMLAAVSERDANGKLIGSLAVTTDVSDVKAAEGDLERKIQELNEANQELERFSYLASHDLRSPLRSCQVVLGHLEQDTADKLDPGTVKQFTMVRERLRQMAKLLEGLLDYTRVGRAPLDVERLHPTAVVENACRLLDPPEGFEIDIQSRMPELVTSWAVLEHVFRNLIGNAISHHDWDRGRIEVRCDPVNKNEVCFTVSDDGPGIPETLQGKAFELYRRGDNSRGGTGLGLALVKRAVERFGGEIELISKEGERGTTFSFTWPKTFRDANN
ncbi:MAG: chemotaxis protein CheB [Geminicoccaceae bacterium]